MVNESERAPRREAAEYSGNLWGATVAFLQRDVKSFFTHGSNREGGDDERVSVAGDLIDPSLDSVEIPVESLVDVSKLPTLAFRREVIDWRDDFHANLITHISNLHDAFARHVQLELDGVGFFRKLIPRDSDEVLHDSFLCYVRWPLIAMVRGEEKKLTGCVRRWGVCDGVDLTFDIRALNGETTKFHGIRFKPSNRQVILSKCRELVLGPTGLATFFCNQGLQLSRKVMDCKA